MAKRIKINYEAINDEALLGLILRDNRGGDVIANVLREKELVELVFDTSPEEVRLILGSGKVKADRLIALQVLVKRLMMTSSKKMNKITSPKDVYDYAKSELYCQKKEHFVVLLMDTKNQIIKSEVVSIGTLNASLVHPREVYREAIKVAANAMILIHNHPSGNATPSQEDRLLTQRLIEAGKIIGIAILDHVIIADHNFYSLKENGEI